MDYKELQKILENIENFDFDQIQKVNNLIKSFDNQVSKYEKTNKEFIEKHNEIFDIL